MTDNTLQTALPFFLGKDTPFYYYDTALLQATLHKIKSLLPPRHVVHYAVKANPNPRLLRIVAAAGMGADCVSGGEIAAAIAAGFPPGKIVFSGVGKRDDEITLGLGKKIYCFNVESVAELDVIAAIAARMGTTAPVALRINPHIDAHTHRYITTGLSENKFGIDISMADAAISHALSLPHVRLLGVHFHIGSQVTSMQPFALLCDRINEWQAQWRARGINMEYINVGGGLGIDYEHPGSNPIPPFDDYFATYRQRLRLYEGQQLHFEPGRAIVGQCGSLITRVLYIKEGLARRFAIVDTGMTDLIRPALYQACHKIEKVGGIPGTTATYDIVGPVCESSDVFATGLAIEELHRGDLLAIRSAGAYGEAMASQYNCRKLPASYFSDDIAADNAKE